MTLEIKKKKQNAPCLSDMLPKDENTRIFKRANAYFLCSIFFPQTFLNFLIIVNPLSGILEVENQKRLEYNSYLTLIHVFFRGRKVQFIKNSAKMKKNSFGTFSLFRSSRNSELFGFSKVVQIN